MARTANKRAPRRRRMWRLLAALLAIATVGGAGAVWLSRWPWREAERIAAELPATSDADVEQRLRQLAVLGDAGLPPLVESLASERACVRESARPLIIETVDRWELLPTTAASQKLAMLAADLADITPRLDGANRRFAADLTLRILHWPRDEATANSSTQQKILADCQRVLSAVAAATKQLTSDGRPSNSPSLASDIESPKITDGANPLIAMSTVRLPGGGIPIELASGPAPHVTSPAVPRPAPNAAEPRRLSDEPQGRPLSEDRSVGSSEPLAPNQPLRLRDRDRRGEDSPDHLAGRPTAKLLSASGNDAAPLDDKSLRRLARSLRSADKPTATAAVNELARRGITGSLLDLAYRLADPNPRVRQQLAEELPQMPGVEGRPWLMELSYDDDPQVRVTAVALLATSGDLQSLKRVRQVSREDPDDQTRAQAQRALLGADRR